MSLAATLCWSSTSGDITHEQGVALRVQTTIRRARPFRHWIAGRRRPDDGTADRRESCAGRFVPAALWTERTTRNDHRRHCVCHHLERGERQGHAEAGATV